MDIEKTTEKLVNEIIDEFRLPVRLCKHFISERLRWAYAAGLDYGRRQRLHAKPVLQYTPEGKFIRRWDSIKEAARALEADSGTIGKVCRGIQHTTRGYIFKFANPEDFDYYQQKKQAPDRAAEGEP